MVKWISAGFCPIKKKSFHPTAGLSFPKENVSAIWEMNVHQTIDCICHMSHGHLLKLSSKKLLTTTTSY